MKALGIPSVILFGLPETKDEVATGAWSEDGIVQKAARAIKREVPDALFVHVVRDGRDAAVSMNKQHDSRHLLGARDRSLYGWALLWQWTVRKGRRWGQKFSADYIDVRYEDLVRDPAKTLSTLGEFLDHDLDYRRIQQNPIGRVASPNTIWS